MTMWKEIATDAEFTALFAGTTIVQATTTAPSGLPYVDADLLWELPDGTWVAMHLANGQGGCDTCGYGADEKRYYVLAA